MADTPNMPDDPGAGTPGGGDTSPVAAGSGPGAGAPPGTGVLPPTGGAIPQNVKQIGKEATAIDVVRACAQALKSQALPFITDRDFSHAIMEAVLKMEKFVPAPGMHDDHAGASQKVAEAIAARRAGAPMGAGGAPQPPPGGRPPGMPQMPPGMPGAPPGMSGPPPTG